MKSLMLLSLEVTKELGDIVSASTIRDCKTITDRFEQEGSSFLTITLPTFTKGLERALSVGTVDCNMFPGFGFHAGLPRFLGGFLSQVFDRSTGVLLDIPNPEAIRAVRQICSLHSKIELKASPVREKRALKGYVETDIQVNASDADRTDPMMAEFAYYSALLYREMFLNIEESMQRNVPLTPKHGPGKTADKLQGNAKFDNRVWTDRLEAIFPAGEYLLPGFHYSQEFETVTWLAPGEELPAKVTLVPKTPKTPRIIAIEPTHMQYMQQGLLRCFVEWIEGDHILSSFIGFSDQDPNRFMARDGSITGALATLDLSEASDRVSVEHVRCLLKHHNLLWEAVDATRTRKAQIRGHGIISLSKFASMGSATCFPVEAMVFLTVIILSIGRQRNHRISMKELENLRGKVRVFGDDLVVPVEYAQGVIVDLEAFGFQVNKSKSFWTGKFRESCGKEYYDGYDVSIVKTRRPFPTSRTDASEVESLVVFRNFLYEEGLWTTVTWLDNRIRKLIPFPIVESTSVGLGRTSFLPVLQGRIRMSGDNDRGQGLQRPVVKAAVVNGKPPISKLDGAGALLKWFLKEGLDPFEEGSYERQGDRKSVV